MMYEIDEAVVCAAAWIVLQCTPSIIYSLLSCIMCSPLLDCHSCVVSLSAIWSAQGMYTTVPMHAASKIQRRSTEGDIKMTISHEVSAALEVSGHVKALPPSFVGKACNRAASGEVHGSRRLPSRPQSGRGKINIAGARQQALNNFSGRGCDKETADGLPHLSVATQGYFSLHLLSWADNIVRRFALDADTGTKKDSRDADMGANTDHRDSTQT